MSGISFRPGWVLHFAIWQRVNFAKKSKSAVEFLYLRHRRFPARPMAFPAAIAVHQRLFVYRDTRESIGLDVRYVEMEEVTGLVAAIFQRGAISASNHAACLKELNELLTDDSGDFSTIFHDSLLVFIFSKQLKAEAATRLREMLAKFLGAHDREQLDPKARETLSKTLSKCMSTLKRACQVQDNDIRACCMAILAVVTNLGAKWWPYVSWKTLSLRTGAGTL